MAGRTGTLRLRKLERFVQNPPNTHVAKRYYPMVFNEALTWCRNQDLASGEDGQKKIIVRVDCVKTGREVISNTPVPRGTSSKHLTSPPRASYTGTTSNLSCSFFPHFLLLDPESVSHHTNKKDITHGTETRYITSQHTHAPAPPPAQIQP